MNQSSSQGGIADHCSGKLPRTQPMQRNEASHKEISLPKRAGNQQL